ncbi:phosphatidylglycerophosphatase A [Campylobacter sp. MIT 19-121]|uniref:phosphatidylglycerophosphatase A family protein n=1 Tax=Campylobacter sp. MIT 19-121 TaxID=2703906 RepID=UPI001389C01D|nr:phosphatidylglycerophosphatase A [Campylobacter sp. MIT 19-121]NDJ27398.1 phosphatidylglycerophosphatase A [Campylobacter sp. MIT 19-121]
MQKCFLTFFYVGLINFAPGTFGSLAALVPAFLILRYLSVETLFLLSFLIFVFSINIINDYEKKTNTHDSKHIVIDEVAGVFLAASLAAWAKNSLFSLFLAFVLFRFFDITKPSVIGKLDKNVKGGLGVMSDDMLAGLFAGLLSAVIYGFGLKFELLSWDIALNEIFR